MPHDLDRQVVNTGPRHPILVPRTQQQQQQSRQAWRRGSDGLPQRGCSAAAAHAAEFDDCSVVEHDMCDVWMWPKHRAGVEYGPRYSVASGGYDRARGWPLQRWNMSADITEPLQQKLRAESAGCKHSSGRSQEGFGCGRSSISNLRHDLTPWPLQHEIQEENSAGLWMGCFEGGWPRLGSGNREDFREQNGEQGQGFPSSLETRARDWPADGTLDISGRYMPDVAGVDVVCRSEHPFCVGCCFYTRPMSQAATSLGHEAIELATIDAEDAPLRHYVRGLRSPMLGFSPASGVTWLTAD
ncbi:hypothetical protein QBC34DRAFT_424472 [Podospora aff. communis PSN243]|uniref:Uncharacterized protein n=1 Tax=Podospora aff. communis PSN243 TaxID=3040156 RepID=A0AAV9GPI0_9PEZI|nr:hypothetical protein QBC34DRAFT_424472 [Podospora aff. communis PSN243]